jgi:hypothetical protein
MAVGATVAAKKSGSNVVKRDFRGFHYLKGVDGV